MVHYTTEQIIELILKDYAGQKLLLLAPLINNRKGHYKELFELIRKKGYSQVRVDGEVQYLVEGMKLDRYKNHTIEAVVDKLKIRHSSSDEEDYRRLRQSIEQAMEQGNGVIGIVSMDDDSKMRYLSRHLMCPTTGLAYKEPAPHTFSFNSPSGWCDCCKGLGKVRLNGDNPRWNIVNGLLLWRIMKQTRKRMKSRTIRQRKRINGQFVLSAREKGSARKLSVTVSAIIR